MKQRHLTVERNGGTLCSECERTVPTSQPVLLVTEPGGEILGFFHRFCIAGAERLALERPGELDLTMVYMTGAELN